MSGAIPPAGHDDDARPGAAPTDEWLGRARRLAALPGVPPYGFDEFARRAGARRGRRRGARRAIGLSALLLLVGAGFANWSAWRPAPAPGKVLAAAAAATAPPAYIDQSWLAALPAEPAVVSVETRMAVAELEDRIAWIDDSLSASAVHGDVLLRIDQLQTERARLVDSLVRVRYAEQLVAANR